MATKKSAGIKKRPPKRKTGRNDRRKSQEAGSNPAKGINIPEVNYDDVAGFLSAYGFSVQDLAEVLDVNRKTLFRWKESEEAFSLQQSDRISVLESILELGKKVLGSEEEVKQWLHSPVHSLDGRQPLDLIKTESGRRLVETALHQIEYGVL
jgi:putative toxin-antitoxin system antitoxin component (TIGR02293 family)